MAIRANPPHDPSTGWSNVFIPAPPPPHNGAIFNGSSAEDTNIHYPSTPLQMLHLIGTPSSALYIHKVDPTAPLGSFHNPYSASNAPPLPPAVPTGILFETLAPSEPFNASEPRPSVPSKQSQQFSAERAQSIPTASHQSYRPPWDIEPEIVIQAVPTQPFNAFEHRLPVSSKPSQQPSAERQQSIPTANRQPYRPLWDIEPETVTQAVPSDPFHASEPRPSVSSKPSQQPSAERQQPIPGASRQPLWEGEPECSNPQVPAELLNAPKPGPSATFNSPPPIPAKVPLSAPPAANPLNGSSRAQSQSKKPIPTRRTDPPTQQQQQQQQQQRGFRHVHFAPSANSPPLRHHSPPYTQSVPHYPSPPASSTSYKDTYATWPNCTVCASKPATINEGSKGYCQACWNEAYLPSSRPRSSSSSQSPNSSRTTRDRCTVCAENPATINEGSKGYCLACWNEAFFPPSFFRPSSTPSRNSSRTRRDPCTLCTSKPAIIDEGSAGFCRECWTEAYFLPSPALTWPARYFPRTTCDFCHRNPTTIQGGDAMFCQPCWEAYNPPSSIPLWGASPARRRLDRARARPSCTTCFNNASSADPSSADFCQDCWEEASAAEGMGSRHGRRRRESRRGY